TQKENRVGMNEKNDEQIETEEIEQSLPTENVGGTTNTDSDMEQQEVLSDFLKFLNSKFEENQEDINTKSSDDGSTSARQRKEIQENNEPKLELSSVEQDKTVDMDKSVNMDVHKDEQSELGSVPELDKAP
ncbi:unnamed protein product, partial [Didymodactylos carnosus]